MREIRIPIKLMFTSYQEPMRAEGQKERPTAVLSYQLSWFTLCPNTADHKNSQCNILADITFLRFDVYTCSARATGTHEIEGERFCDRDVALFCSTPCVPWRQQPARPRIKVPQPTYSRRSSDKDPKTWISDSDSLRTIGNCAKASLYKKMTPQFLNVKQAGSPKRNYSIPTNHPGFTGIIPLNEF